MLHLVSLRRERIFVHRNDELKYLHQGALGLTSSIEINLSPEAIWGGETKLDCIGNFMTR